MPAPRIMNRSPSRITCRDKLVDPLHHLFDLRDIPSLRRHHTRAIESLDSMRPIAAERVDQGQATVRPLHKRLIVIRSALQDKVAQLRRQLDKLKG